jgi:hypothetical protein
MAEIEDKINVYTTEKNKPSLRFEAIFPKLFCAFTSFLGCLVLLVAPFYFPLVNLLGAIVVGILSAALAVFMIHVAVSGFGYAGKLSPRTEISFAYTLTVYMVSMFCLLLSLVSFCRLTTWIFVHFFGIKIDWIFIPA